MVNSQFASVRQCQLLKCGNTSTLFDIQPSSCSAHVPAPAPHQCPEFSVPYPRILWISSLLTPVTTGKFAMKPMKFMLSRLLAGPLPRF